MATDHNDLQQKAHSSGEAVVDHQETGKQRISPLTGRPVKGIDWTKILEEHNLESPGYKETIEKMKRDGKINKPG